MIGDNTLGGLLGASTLVNAPTGFRAPQLRRQLVAEGLVCASLWPVGYVMLLRGRRHMRTSGVGGVR
jgi:hypothetical protein